MRPFKRANFTAPLCWCLFGLGVSAIAHESIASVDDNIPRELLYVDMSADQMAPCVIPDERTIYTKKRSCSGTGTLLGQPYQVRINSMGIRGPEYSSRPPQGKLRILFIGDSDVFCPGANESETLPKLMEQAAAKSGMNVEVINAGMERAGAIQSALRLEELLVAYRPDFVFFMIAWANGLFTDSFLEENLVYRNGNPFGIQRDPMNGYPNWLKKFVYSSSWRTRLALNLYELAQRRAVSKAALSLKSDAERIRFLTNASIHSLKIIKNAASSHGSKLVLVYPTATPTVWNAFVASPFYFRELTKWYHRLFIPEVIVVDDASFIAALEENLGRDVPILQPDRKGLRQTPENVRPDLIHFTASGQKQFAEMIWREHLESQSVKRPKR